MPIQQAYTTGTATVTAGSPIVTGQGTAWALMLVNGGLFTLGGLAVPIQSVESDTSLTLAYPWPGATGTGAYAIDLGRADAASAIVANRRLADLLAEMRGPLMEFRFFEGMLQFRNAGSDETWNDLVPVSELQGETGATGPQGPVGPMGPARPEDRNFIINSDWSINQELFNISSYFRPIAQGEYFRDRWAAVSGGASLYYYGARATLDGAIGTIIEAPGLAGRPVTASLEDPEGDVHIGLSAFGSGSGSVNGVITAGLGQRSVTFTVPATATGDLLFEVATTAAVAFSPRFRLEVGGTALPWQPPDELELMRCQRHFAKSFDENEAIGNTSTNDATLMGFVTSSMLVDSDRIYLPVEMRNKPTIKLYSSYDAAVIDRWHGYSGSAWVALGREGITGGLRITAKSFIVRHSHSSILPVGSPILLQGHWTADARPDMSTINSSWVGLL